jgi:hypothetical protein
MKTTIEILKEARELIAKEGGWTQGWYARDADGAETLSSSEAAVCFCIIGAFRRVSHDEIGHAQYALSQLLDGWSIPTFNDAPGRTQAEVVAKFDEAIAAEEAKASAA